MNKNALIGYKLLFAALGISAVITEIVVLIDRGVFAPVNFFSYFTVESNIFAAVMLAVSATALITGRKYAHLDILRGAATLYMVTTGIVFSVLLSGLDPGVLTAVPWDNTVLHYIMPVVLLIDWILDPPKARIPLKKALLWLIYPIVYVVYSLVRGHFVGWYPYPFLDPSEDGYIAVAITAVCIAVFVSGLAWLLTRYPKIQTQARLN